MNLLIFGFGYSARHYWQDHARGQTTTATVTSSERALALTQPGLGVVVFSPEGVDPRLEQAVASADMALVSVPPDADGDPVLRAFSSAIAAAPVLRTIVYLSTIGVYGDHGGAWIDETSACWPSNNRSRWRLEAENDWQALAKSTGKSVHILRLAGIYGPGQNALINLRAGTARRIIKPGQVFNRIHVTDIGPAIAAGFAHHSGGVWNVCDDEPAPAEDVVIFAAQLMGVTPPPEIPFASAQMSPMARSFYSETKRASNRAMKEQLGVTLAYPTYREGIRALHEGGDGVGAV